MDWLSIESGLFRPLSPKWTAFAFVAIVVVGAADYYTGPEFTFSVFYLVPVAFAAWLSGTTVAIAASAFAAIVWLCAEFASSRIDANMFVYSWNFCSRLLFLSLVALLLARLRQILDRERDLSRSDPLTGLLNARGCREIVGAEIARAQRHGYAVSIAFIDVDDFKRVNDTGGHSAGDRLLVSLAKAIRGSLRASDSVARYGGDEFVVMLPFADRAAAQAVAEKLVGAVQAAMTLERWPVTLSLGVVTCETVASTITVDALLQEADRLMYDVKSSGKDGVRFVSHSGSGDEFAI